MQHRATSLRASPLRSLLQGLVWVSLAGIASAQVPAKRDAAPANTSAEVGDPSTATAPTPSEHATSAVAEQSPQTSEATPDSNFQVGLAALAEGRNKDAVTAFQAAFDHDGTPAALMNLGIAYTNLDRPQAAVQALEGYISHADPQSDAATIQAVSQEVDRLRRESGRIGLHLIPEHATVEIDGEPVDGTGAELLAPTGRHTISAHADGYAPFSQSVDIVPGAFTLEIELKPLDLHAIAAAEPPQPAAPVAAPEPADELEPGTEGECILSQVCMGPVVALLGPPNLIGGGLHARIGRYLGVGVDYQVLPTLNLNPVSFGASLVSANARVYPFAGAFFVSGGIGYQSFRAQIRDGSITLSAKTGFPALMASVGFMGRSGFVLGADLGLMFPLSTLRASIQDETGALARSAIPQSDIDAAREKAQNSVNSALNALPLLVQVNLLRVGYMF